MSESFNLDAYIDDAFMRKVFFVFYIPVTCTYIIRLIRCIDLNDMLTDPSWVRNNHLQGLKDIGQAYIGETYTVSRQKESVVGNALRSPDTRYDTDTILHEYVDTGKFQKLRYDTAGIR
ncbi:transmembrane protein, putative [Medicago truncatula]|uniref:Transmembrane protein, putative n=1 Tax=Medicago truncatula TaxID=3880 RepID=G7JHL6_MEDTR|nr:transmembrane protein, putative [Medicago truncatula]